jgi:hypothetical protein
MQLISRTHQWCKSEDSGWMRAVVRIEPNEFPADKDDVEAWEDLLGEIAHAATVAPVQVGQPGGMCVEAPEIKIDYLTNIARIFQVAYLDV